MKKILFNPIFVVVYLIFFSIILFQGIFRLGVFIIDGSWLLTADIKSVAILFGSIAGIVACLWYFTEGQNDN